MEIHFSRAVSGRWADPVAAQAFRHLVSTTLDTPGNVSGLQELARSPGRALATIRQQLAEGASHPDVDPDWLRAIYAFLRDAAAEASGSLAAGEPPPRPVHRHAEVLGENAQIGVAFRTVFVPGTPTDLLTVESQFSDAEQVPSAVREMLLQHPSVSHGGEWAARLVPYGLTPASILGACVSIGNSLRRIKRMHTIEQDKPTTLDMLVQALQYVTQMPTTNAQCLVNWIIQLGIRCKPHIIQGYEIQGYRLIGDEQFISIDPLAERRRDAEFLWKSELPPDNYGLR